MERIKTFEATIISRLNKLKKWRELNHKYNYSTDIRTEDVLSQPRTVLLVRETNDLLPSESKTTQAPGAGKKLR